MSRAAAKRRREAEQRVKRLFEATGHDVDEVVGSQPGTVARFAVSRRGLTRPRTYWVVWLERPDSVRDAERALEEERRRHGADRALGILMDGALPTEYRLDLEAHIVNTITYSRLALELTGIADQIRELAQLSSTDPGHPDMFVPRQAITESGETVDAVAYIEEWLDREPAGTLLIQGPEDSGKTTLCRHIALRCAQAHLDAPGQSPPVLYHSQPRFHRRRSAATLSRLIQIERYRRSSDFIAALQCVSTDHHSLIVETSVNKEVILGYLARVTKQAQSLPRPISTLTLVEPVKDAVLGWYCARLPESHHRRLTEVMATDLNFASLACRPAHMPLMVSALNATPLDVRWWLGEVVAYCIRNLVTPYSDDEIADLEAGAMEQFAMGTSRVLADLVRHFYYDDDPLPAILGWFNSRDEDAIDEAFTNRLIRDYFIARRIATEAREGNDSILTRHHFPQDYVLLFLAIVAPDVAAMASADRIEELRAQIESEAEVQLQNTLAHHLRRSAGAIRSNFNEIVKHLSNPGVPGPVREIRRIHRELDYLSALAEQTRKWHEVPEAVRETLQVTDELDSALQQLRDQYERVELIVDIPQEVYVSASRRHLTEALHNILENAFQALYAHNGPTAPRITIRAEGRGDTVCISISDNGPGIAPDDRERIFDPRVTTKKGGNGAPLGTGMGLPIARRYLGYMGGRVTLNPDSDETCFVIELVAGGPINDQ